MESLSGSLATSRGEALGTGRPGFSFGATRGQLMGEGGRSALRQGALLHKGTIQRQSQASKTGLLAKLAVSELKRRARRLAWIRAPGIGLQLKDTRASRFPFCGLAGGVPSPPGLIRSVPGPPSRRAQTSRALRRLSELSSRCCALAGGGA